MSDLTAIISVVPPVAIPIVAVILGLAYLYFEYGKIEKDRAHTKAERDADSISVHDTLLKHSFQIDELKGRTVHHEEILEDLRKQIAILNENIIKLSVTIESFFKK